MSGFATVSDLESHIRTDWKAAHRIWENLYKEGSPIVALLPIHELDGAYHTVSGLTAGHVLTALTPGTFGFAAPAVGSEVDPVFVASPAHGITAENIAAWNAAYGWGNHAGLYSLLGHNHSGVYEPVLGNPAADGYILSSTALGVRSWIAPGGGAHDLLSATHGDTTAAAVVRGDVMIGVGATPKWERLADVAAGAYFRSGGVGLEPLWSTLILPNAATAFRLPVATAANTIGELAGSGATGEYLAGVTGAIPAWATLNQAAIPELTTASGPTFAHLHISDLAAIYTAAESWIGPSATVGIYFKNNYIGIGEVPTMPFEIRVPHARVSFRSTTGTNYTYSSIINTGGTFAFGIEGSAGGSIFLGTPAYAGVIGYSGTYPLMFATTNTVRMTILADGSVLIGATEAAFTEKLAVVGANGGIAGIYLNDATPSTTTTTLYRSGNDLYWGATKLN